MRVLCIGKLVSEGLGFVDVSLLVDMWVLRGLVMRQDARCEMNDE